MASDLMNVGATGRYYKVQSNGKAQSGLSEGDRVVTSGGTYQILKVNADGSYQSALYDANITTNNYSGTYANAGVNSPYSGSTSLSSETKKSIAEAYDSDYSSSVSKDKYESVVNSKPSEYESAYKKEIESLLDRLENREAFSYDLSSDVLYQQYKDSYMNAGKQAMEDTIGQASALTGGYSNTYAQSERSAAYESYQQKLNHKIPELYENARSVYEAEGDELYRLYSLYSEADKADYEKYRDSISDWMSERDFAYSEYMDEADRVQQDYYNKLSLLQDAAKLESSDYWNSIEQQNNEWEQAYKTAQFDYEKEQNALKQASSSSSSSSGSSSSSSGKSVTTSVYDGALKAYEDGGEASLAMYAEKLNGSGYSASGISDVLSYARKYGKAPAAKTTVASTGKTNTSGFSSVLVDLFNYRG
ncbi:MAG: hypothetical protein LUE88_01425 [Clostridiales bacterium]|nr:hypothetical protein [Clostridiales bacterium]